MDPIEKKSGGVLGRRGQFLEAIRRMTFESGHFTTLELAKTLDVPRSTAQDWVARLLSEECIFVKEEKHGRHPAKYASRSAMPATTCKRIFTTVDSDLVEIFHECLSSGCAGFCEYHHRKAGGAAISVTRDGMMFCERAKISEEGKLDLSSAAVGLLSVRRDGENIVQTIRSIHGGPAYSLSSMMGHAKGVCGVEIHAENGFVTGEVKTKALVHVTVGIDDTDKKGCGGATFALSQALLKYLSERSDVIGIRHQVAVLAESIEEKTAGNSCSFIELAVEPKTLPALSEQIIRFVEEESVSENWGVAIAKGILVPFELLSLARKIRLGRVSLNEALLLAEKYDVEVFGGRGIIGAVAAVSLREQPQEVLLDLSFEVV